MTISNNGGAFYNIDGTVSLGNLSFIGNRATDGGAIRNDGGVINLTDVMFSGNTASQYGGAVHNKSGTITLASATFSENIATTSGGAIYNNSGCLLSLCGSVCLSTADDTIYNAGTLNWNISGDDAGYLNDYSLLENHGTLSITVDADQATGNYILVGNAASAAGQSFTLTGVSGQSDISLTVNGNAKSYNGVSYALKTEQDSLILASYQRVVVTTDQTVSLTAGTYCNPMCYDGNGGVAEVQSDGVLTVTGTLENKIIFTGNTAMSGGAICNAGTITLEDVRFQNNTAANSSAHGGGAFYNNGVVTLTNVAFDGNHTESAGGAIDSCGTVIATDTTFSDNTATSYGGAISNDHGTMALTGTTFSGNTTSASGGAIGNSGTITLLGATFSGNSASCDGGAIFGNSDGTITLTNVTFTGNSSSGKGGAIYNYKGIIALAGAVTLTTANDTIYNTSGATIKWSIAGDGAGYLNDYSLLENHGTLSITVNADQATGNYILAGNAASAAGQSFTLTGVSGQSDVSITVGGNAVNYDHLCYTLQNQSDNLVLSATNSVFYCSSWNGAENVSVSWQGNTYKGTVGNGIFFRDYTAAKAAAQAANSELVVMESGTITKSTSYGAQDVTLSSSDVVYNRMVLGGNLQAGNHLDFAGSYMMTVENGTFASDFAGGDAANGYVLRTGDVTVNVSGGTFAKSLAAGSYYATTGSVLGMAAIDGDLTLLISGGSFTGRVYGGNSAMTDQLGSCTALQGDTNLMIDASTNAISFGECVTAGSRGHGVINGSTNVTVTGNGANLTFADTSILFGGCSGDYYNVVGGVRTASTSVMGDRKLTFDDFTGNFGAEIRMFSDISLENSTDVNFADEKLDLKEVENWNFDCTSCATNLNKNKFTGDAINVDTTGLTTSWTLLSGDAAAFADLGNATLVTLGGNTATWSGSAWSDGTYTLAVEDETKLVISKLA